MNIILDLIVIAIIAVFAFLSAKRGFVRTLIEIVGFVLVILLANSVSTPLANLTYDKAVEPAIIKSVEGIQADSNTAVNIEVEALPSFVKNIADDGGVISDFENKIAENINSGIETAVATASQNVIKPVVTNILSLIYVLIITVVLLFIVNILANVINKLFSFSIIGKANKTLGGILGIIKGVIIAFVFCTLISLIVSFTENGFLIFTNEAISNSYIFKLLCLAV